jgi:hypothetical protein
VFDASSSNLGAVFAFDGPSGAQIEVVESILARGSTFQFSRVLCAVGSDMLCSAVRDNSCPSAAAALKLLSVPLWACLKSCDAIDAPVLSHAAHHATVAVLLCRSTADAALLGGSSLLQLLVSSCVSSSHAVLASAPQSSDISNLIKQVVDAWRSNLLRAPSLLRFCPSVFHPQHANSARVWSLLLQNMLVFSASLDDAALVNIISISKVFNELKLTCQLVATLPSSSLHVITRDVIALFLREVCPESMNDLTFNAAAFTSWLQSLSPAQLDLNQEMTRLMCNVAAPILRSASFVKALPILNLCAFESPIPALFVAQNTV